MKKRWTLRPANKELQQELGRKLNILPLTAQLLINRGLVDSDKAFSFLRPELKDIHDPFLFRDMDKAVARITGAIRSGERIAIYGDYDVDGTTSTALLYLFFKEIGVDVRCYIPQRLSEGYGINAGAIKRLASEGVKLIITVDCGVSSRAEVALASSLGIDVIITDHHELPKDPPGACAILDPKEPGSGFPFSGLAGVGVAFNLAMALRIRLRQAGWFKSGEPNLKRYLDLVAIGTVADMVPLVDENRILVSHGLKELQSTLKPGLRALKESAGLKGPRVNCDHIAFQIAPRINAAGRVEDASTALRLLVSEDADEAARLCAELGKDNSSRQRIEERILKEALSMLDREGDGGAIVLHSEAWHPGVIGIVASKLVDRFAKPVVMIALEGTVGKGSARGAGGFDILEGLKSCSGRLERFGGHKAAAGLTVRKDNIDAFKNEFLRYIKDAVPAGGLLPEIVLDAEVGLEEINNRMVEEIDALSPFGFANTEPLLCVNGAEVVQTEVVGTRHLKLRVRQNGCMRSGIGFGLAGLHPVGAGRFGIAFSPYMDEWQGNRDLRLRIKDIQAGA